MTLWLWLFGFFCPARYPASEASWRALPVVFRPSVEVEAPYDFVMSGIICYPMYINPRTNVKQFHLPALGRRNRPRMTKKPCFTGRYQKQGFGEFGCCQILACSTHNHIIRF